MEKHSINHNTTNDSNMLLSAVVSDAKHLLRCKHCIGTRCAEYFMACIHLGKTKSGKVKVLVFGERNWAGRDDCKRIRYVDEWRVIYSGR